MPAKKKTDEKEIKITTEEVQYESKGKESDLPEKPKRTRKKKTDGESAEKLPAAKAKRTKTKESVETVPNEDADSQDRILTIEAGARVSTEDSQAEIAWHEIQNAYITRRILTGMLVGVERNDVAKDYAVTDYNGYRIIIPLKEMFFDFPNNTSGEEYRINSIKYQKLLNSMLGAKIDFIVKGIDSKSKSVVASRSEAMYKKRQTFYMETDKNGMFRIYEDRIVQARVIAVAEKAIRVEIFGVDCAIPVKDLSWDWIGDARERFSIGDEILVRIKEVKRDSIKDLFVSADARSVTDNRTANLELCKIQGKYAGRVTDTHKGVVYIRLNNGVNAIAHSCLDRRMPGKKDDVSFAVTSLDKDKGIALGVITRIIKQNL